MVHPQVATPAAVGALLRLPYGFAVTRYGAAAFARARRLSGAVIAVAGAVGALGGAAVNIAFKLSYSDGSGSGAPAFFAFLAYYALCMVLVRAVYPRRRPAGHTAATDRLEATNRV
ncbi:hypothetical protein [Streptomyces anandii]|uniref:hypothetical protein n=1 Tax=Streptomyces anandii TaxID=285454 RepID=UPI001678C42B|nr:hypothetical protein [Streptomyces anandii]GGX90964.1 hypothetical protein GCM10010510_40180 [Streptomyces anandii JCM 4720]